MIASNHSRLAVLPLCLTTFALSAGGQSGPAVPVSPQAARANAGVTGACANVLVDRATGQCTIPASSAPTVGMLLPLQPEYFEQQEILSHMSIVFLDDGKGGKVKTLRISGINVQIVNGLDATNGYPTDPDTTDPGLTATNGLGNLIVGYNELGNPDGDNRSGSHNIVFGHGNSYSSFGGLAGPRDNTTSAPFASVSGGRFNQATGENASVTGGMNNLASNLGSSVSGGRTNTASHFYASVSGGEGNIAAGAWSSVSGGSANRAGSYYSSVSGGRNNLAVSQWSSVSGGNVNTANGPYSSISGGERNTAMGEFASVSGGQYNGAGGDFSVVGGGLSRSVSGDHDWRAGTLFEED